MWDSSRSLPIGASAPSAPKVLGRFRCDDKLGAEGPLETYRARVSGFGGFDRLYAVTSLVAGALGRRPHAAEALLRAARAVGSVKDARIATVAESGLAPGSAFVASELVHGVSLSELLAHVGNTVTPRTPLPGVWGAVIASIGADVAGALAVAHAAAPAVVHGALSLGNVMITPQGTVKLIDFGLFAAVHTPAEIAAAPTRAGLTAPELAQGRPLAPAADVYALGAVLERLAAATPRQAAPGSAVAPSARSFPAGVRALLQAMMVADPARRPEAAAVEAGLREILRELRGVDVAVEIGTLVRLIIQLRPAAAADAEASAEARPAEELAAGASGPVPKESFSDEPTAIVDVASGGDKSSSLAAILREMRNHAEASAPEEELPQLPDSGATRLAPVALSMLPPSSVTPAGGFAVEQPATALAPAGYALDDGESSEATMVSTEAPPLSELLPPELRASRAGGVPASELSGLTSGEIASGFGRAAYAPTIATPAITGFALPDEPSLGSSLPVPVAPPEPSAAPAPITFAEFSEALPVRPAPAREPKRETVTPPSWEPSGDLEGPALEARPGRSARRSPAQRPRTLFAAALAAVLVSAVAVALLVAG